MKDWKAGDFCDWSPEGHSYGTHAILALHEGVAWLLSQDGDHDTADVCDLYPTNEIVGGEVETPDWDDEALPPVGLVCEVDHSEEWRECTIIAHFEQPAGMVAAYTVEYQHGVKTVDARVASSFRPIRTPKQRAEDGAAQAMADVAYQSNGVECHVTHEGAAAIYAAIRDGKIPGVILGSPHE